MPPRRKPTKKTLKNRPGQMAETEVPSQKTKGKDMRVEVGGSGTNLMNGVLTEDYNASMLGTVGLEIFDKMRKSDAQVHATLLYCELPILSTRWSIQPAKNEDGEVEEQDQEIADFVTKALFEHMQSTWNDFLREVLTMLPFGHSVFEMVWELQDEMVWLKKLASRKQMTIQSWEMQDKRAGITQYLPDGSIRNIPADKLVIFTLRREGDNYAGQSLLRTAYRHWYIKDRLYRFDTIKHERQSLGVLKIVLPKEHTTEDMARALTIIRNVRNIEQAGIAVPSADWEVDFMDMKGKGGTDLFESINHHDRKIATNILAQFMELGAGGGGGSYALSEDQSSLFLQSNQAIAVYIRDIVNRFIIQRLVDYNFDTDRYPTLTFDKLGDVKITDFASAIGTLVGAGAVTMDPQTEAVIRERMNLPPASQVEPEEEDPMEPDLEDDEIVADDTLDDEPEAEEIDEELPEDPVDLSEVFFSEIEGLYELGEDHVTEVYELAVGGSLSPQQKAAIAQGLKEYWDRKGRKGKPGAVKARAAARVEADAAEDESQQAKMDQRVGARGGDTKTLLKKKDQLVQKIQATRTQIEQLSTQYQNAIDAATSPAEKRKLRAERKAILTPLKKIRREDIDTRVGVNKILRARRRELGRKIKAIRDAVKEKRLTMKEAMAPMRREIESNNEQIQELRRAAKGLKGEKAKALRAAISGLLEDNATIRDGAADMRETYSTERDAAQKEIDAAKKDSGFFSEHVHQHPGDQIHFELSQLLRNRDILALQRDVDPIALADLKKKGFVTNEYEKRAWRPLTLAERNANLTLLSDTLDRGSAAITEKFSKEIERAKKSLLDQVRFAVKYNDTKALAKLAVPKDVLAGMAKVLTDIQKDMFDAGKTSAAAELGVKIPGTSAEVKATMRIQNDAIVGKIAWNLEAVAAQAATEAITKTGAGAITDTTQKDAIETVKDAMDAIVLSEEQEGILSLTETALQGTIQLAEASADTLSVTGALNLGRASIAERYPERIYAVQFSAVLDGRTTAICRSLDGIVVKMFSDDYYAYAPPRHIHCRSLYFYILQETTFKPPFTEDIPKSIPRNSSAMNAPAMKAPVLGPQSSPKSISLVQQEIAARTKKLDEYVKAGTHPNRVAAHRDAISNLKKGLEGIEVGLKQDLARKVVLEDGAEIRTPTGYVYGVSDAARRTIAKQGISGGAVVSPAAAVGEGTLYRIPAGKADDIGIAKPAGSPDELQQYVIKNDAAPDVIEVWDGDRNEWVPVTGERGAGARELSEVVKAILMCEGVAFARLAPSDAVYELAE